MFQKPFRIKSNSQLRNSERRGLKNKIISTFPSLTEKNFDQIFTRQDPIYIAKIITYGNALVTVYLVRKRAMFFEHNDVMFPTVYFLWHFPDIVLCFTTHAPVVSKLMSGADLMLPGVVLHEGLEGPTKYGKFEKDTLVAINITSNKAAFAVGVTYHSSEDMYMAAGRGKCVKVYHTLHDHLSQMETTNSLPVPELGRPTLLNRSNNSDNISVTQMNQTTVTETKPQETSVAEEDTDNKDTVNAVIKNLENVSISKNTADMDKLLTYCFLKALKNASKKLQLPILTSNFYRLHMIAVCPNGKNLEIKKTSYKKLNKFLNKMTREGIINVTEQKKGVESIIAINFDHPKLTEFVQDESDVPEQLDIMSQQPTFNVEENFTVTAAVLPIFADAGLRKGNPVKASEVRKHITEYVRRKKLNSLHNRGIIIPNKELAEIINTDEGVTWEELMTKIFKLMSSSFKITTTNSQVSGTGKVEPIVLSIGSRSGNKKVTLVDNLALYGIHPSDFGKECQHGIAASTSVSKPAGKKYPQLLIQGNQISFVGKILTEKYNIPKRFIRGLELAPKNKK